jgi:beta-lactamase class A
MVSPMTDASTATAALVALADAFDGVLTVAARDEATGDMVALDADRAMPTASVIKLAVLAAVFDRAHAGGLSLGDRIAVDDQQRVGGSGVVKELSAGTRLTIRDLATLMVVVSDNMATNLLIDVAGGVEAINRYVGDELGLPTVTLRRKLMFSGGRGHLALAAPRDLAELMSRMQGGRLVSPEASHEMLGMLARQQYLDQVPRLFDREVLGDDSEVRQSQRLRVACKTGMIDGVRADAGVIWLDGRAVSYAVMSESSGDRGRDLDSDAQLVNAEAGWILISHLWPGQGPPPLAAHPAAIWSRLHAAADPP